MQNALGDHPALDGHVLFHAQAQHEVLHALAAEDAQQIVLQGEEETRAAGVALAAGSSAELVIDAPGFVALGGHDVEAAQSGDFVVFHVGMRLGVGVDFVPFVAAHPVELVVVGEEVEMLVGHVLGLVLGEALGHLVLEAGVLGHELGVSAEQNIGAAAGHVGGDGDGVLAAGLRHDGCFALVILGVQDLVLDAHALEDGGEPFRLLDRDGAHQDGLAPLVEFHDLLGGVAKLLHLGAVDHVLIFLADQGTVGGNDGDVEVVDFLEFGRFGFRRAGHAGELLVHAEVILEGDGGEGLVLALDLDVFLGFHGLVEAVGPAAAGHDAAGELVDDDHFGAFVAVLHQVIAVALVDDVRAQGLLHVVVVLDVGGDRRDCRRPAASPP